MIIRTEQECGNGNTHTPQSRDLCLQTIYLPETGQITYLLQEDRTAYGSYSYAITVRCLGEGAFAESRTVRDITADRDLALSLFWQVCRGQVTPWGLLDLLPELLP